MSVKKETQTEPVQTYEGLQNSRQTFHAIGHFDVVGSTIVMRAPDEMKRINPRKYRDRIYKIDEAIDRYISTGQQIIKFAQYGVRGSDELQSILEDFGSKITEAIREAERHNEPVSAKALRFTELYRMWRAVGSGILIN